MKKTVLIFGLASAAISIALMAATLPFIDSGRYGVSDVLGYTSMLLAALVVFFGVRSYRERSGGGRIGFARAVSVGFLITLVSAACYAAAFQVVYFQLMPQFGERFTACMVERARDSGASREELERTARRARELKRLYDRPVTNAALSLATTVPVGLVAALISAAILRRR